MRSRFDVKRERVTDARCERYSVRHDNVLLSRLVLASSRRLRKERLHSYPLPEGAKVRQVSELIAALARNVRGIHNGRHVELARGDADACGNVRQRIALES